VKGFDDDPDHRIEWIMAVKMSLARVKDPACGGAKFG
jgi:hypothetical protein